MNKNSVSGGNLILSRDILKSVSHLSQDLKMKLYALSVVRKDFSFSLRSSVIWLFSKIKVRMDIFLFAIIL